MRVLRLAFVPAVSTVDSDGRTSFVADAHRGDGKRFVVRADEKLTAFVELESAIRAPGSEKGAPTLSKADTQTGRSFCDHKSIQQVTANPT
jgi:hypothetical protein